MLIVVDVVYREAASAFRKVFLLRHAAELASVVIAFAYLLLEPVVELRRVWLERGAAFPVGIRFTVGSSPRPWVFSIVSSEPFLHFGLDFGIFESLTSSGCTCCHALWRWLASLEGASDLLTVLRSWASRTPRVAAVQATEVVLGLFDLAGRLVERLSTVFTSHVRAFRSLPFIMASLRTEVVCAKFEMPWRAIGLFSALLAINDLPFGHHSTPIMRKPPPRRGGVLSGSTSFTDLGARKSAAIWLCCLT